MGRVTEAMLAELRADVVDIPESAVTLADIMSATGLTYNPAVLRMKTLVASGKWKRAKRGVRMWYWQA